MAIHFLQYLFFWNLKTPNSNDWHPQLKQHSNPSSSIDVEALAVDTAPLIFAAGALTHARQIFDFGFTARASVFHNPRTLTALHRATLLAVPVVLGAQVLGWEYRNALPRFASDGERARDEAEVRRHVGVGMMVGALVWVARMGLGKRGVWAPVEVVLGGAGADWMHREYLRAHGGSSVMV